ncbi:thiamine pyrophosphate-binding protein [Brevibacterium sp. HMSC063G07]|uniref:thiamine pyrophosphate-binding protein n=1 Tax=Brevibacterium sp. HMSC063G07 TaxID=1739261 RepID=UPI0008A5D0AF|nr:thiamine pyrophosphate-binding protein [Brevibacterium sp. HMSC063G07]OFL66420.1 hypothetical protein HMPREF2757_03395 [Brevibacterium sp. HMSC063G07]
MNTSTATARTIALSLIRRGLEHVVIAPGSRSAPLTYAFAELADAGLVNTHVRIDERDAAFFALGLAKGLRRTAVADASVRAFGGAAAAGVRGAEPSAVAGGVSGSTSPQTPGLVAVLTTSGTAVANLHPAVLEASYSQLPLLILSADRPERLRRTGANQTIDRQSHVLGDVRLRFDAPAEPDEASLTASVHAAVAAAVGSEGAGAGMNAPYAMSSGLRGLSTPGPVQFNVQFDGELTPKPEDMPWRPEVGEANRLEHRPHVHAGFAQALEMLSRPGTVLLAGSDCDFGAHRAGELAVAFGVPVFAEPSSPLFHLSVPGHPGVLDDDLAESITGVVRTGRITQYRQDQRLLANLPTAEIQTDLDWAPADEYGSYLASAGLTGQTPDADAKRWGRTAASESHIQRAAGVRETLLGRTTGVIAGQPTVTSEVRSQHREAAAQWHEVPPTPAEPPAGVSAVAAIVGAAAENAAEHGTVAQIFLASSNAGRYASALAGNEALGRVQMSASRGLAGIDGLIATAAGMALTGPVSKQCPLRLIIGDVAALHDVGGLLREGGSENLPALQIFVLNDDGGAIFGGLEHGAGHLRRHFARYFATRHGRNFRALAEAYGWPYQQVAAEDLLAAAKAGSAGLFEVPLV